MTDLVCASSACPDDIDPANGWEITDVHVRVYSPENRFSTAIAHRVTPEAEPVLTKETTFNPRTRELTESFVEYRGYWLPHCYNNEGAIAEYWACREKAVVMDLSPLRKWEVLGPDAETLIQWAITRDARRLAVGHVVYTAVCNETGGMIDDATVFRLGDDNFRFIGGDEYTGVWLKELAERLGLHVLVKPSTDQLHNLAVQGPESRELMKQLVWTPPTQPGLDELKWFRFLVGRFGGYDGIPVVVSRTGYTGELGYEVFCHPDDGPAVWDAIWEAGQAARAEAARARGARHDPHRGRADLRRATSSTTRWTRSRPGSASRSSSTARTTSSARRRSIERQAHPQRRLVGLELDGNETAGHGDERVRRPPPRGRRSPAEPAARRSVRTSRCAGWPCSTPSSGPTWRWASSTGSRSGSRPRSCACPFYDPDKTRPRS